MRVYRKVGSKYFLLQASLLLLFLTILTAGILSVSGIGYPVYFPYIPLFYYIYSLLLHAFIKKYKAKKTRMPIYMLTIMRFIRFVGSLGILVLGIICDKEHILQYVVIFAVFYCVYLLLETRTMMAFEKELDLMK